MDLFSAVLAIDISPFGLVVHALCVCGNGEDMQVYNAILGYYHAVFAAYLCMSVAFWSGLMQRHQMKESPN